MEPEVVQWSPPPKRPPMPDADMAWVLDYLRHSFDRPSFDQDNPADLVDMAIWIEDLQRYDRDVCHEAIRNLRRSGSGRWFPAHAEVEQAIAAVLRKREQDRPQLVEDTGPPLPADVQKANVAALRRRRPRGSDPQPLAASMPRIRASAHHLDDHQFCGPECVPVAETHAAGDHQFCPPDCTPPRSDPVNRPNTHLSPHPVTAGVTGILLGVVTVVACLGVLWLAFTVGARLAVGMAG